MIAISSIDSNSFRGIIDLTRVVRLYPGHETAGAAVLEETVDGMGQRSMSWVQRHARIFRRIVGGEGSEMLRVLTEVGAELGITGLRQ